MNAVCNIAAGSNDNEALFVNRDPFVHFSPHLLID